MSEIYIENLTWQGRPTGSTQPSGWSVTLGQVVNVFGQEKVNISAPMTPDQLAGMGMDLPAVLSSIDVQLNTAHIAAQAKIAQLEQENDNLRSQVASLTPAPAGDNGGETENVA